MSAATPPDHRGFPSSSRFEIRRRLGAGGFGEVFEAFDRERGAKVALKLLRRGEAADLYRFKQEFRALADLTHPNLVRRYDLVVEGDRWLFTMELVDGADVVDFARPDGVASPKIGRVLAGRYRLVERLAEGGMASVYRATSIGTRQDVAVKIMHPMLASDSTFARRFQREARLTARLSHPRIARVLDHGVDRVAGRACGLAELVSRGTVLVGPMEQADLRRALIAPAEAAGHRFEPRPRDARAHPGELRGELESLGGAAAPEIERVLTRLIDGPGDPRLWSATSYCMSIDVRRMLLDMPDAQARADLTRCSQRVRSALSRAEVD